jgi:hypothetical protein
MFCTSCGKEIPDDSKFCTNCGTTLGDNESSAPEAAQTPPQPEPQPAQAQPAPPPQQPQAAPQQQMPPQPAPMPTNFKTGMVMFEGKGGKLFGILLVSWLLCAITAGIYTPWAYCKIKSLIYKIQ